MTAADRYVSFFERQEAALSRRRREARVWLLTLVVLLVGLLWLLRSEWPVWIYVLAILVGLGTWGFIRLRIALDVAGEAIDHLRQIADEIGQDADRRSLTRFVRGLTTPEDRSHVPETFQRYLEERRHSDRPAEVSQSAFSAASEALTFAGFMRSVLILGGLFGTVLFFAFELTGDAVLNADLTELIPGLRGALASTLAGISGSVLLGFYTDRVDNLVDELIRETEGFVSGPLADVARKRPERAELRDETELWESLRQEVELMTRRIEDEYAAMSDDVHAHAESLQDLGDRLADAPPIQVPEQLKRLDESVEEFKHSARLFGELVPPLLEAVAAMEVFAPARTLSRVEQLHDRVESWSEETDQSLKDLSSTMEEAHADIEAAAERASEAADRALEGPERVLDRMDDSEDTRQEMSDAIGQLRRAAQKEQEARREGLRHLKALGADVAAVQDSVDDARDRASSVAEELHRAASRLDENLDALSPLVRTLESKVDAMTQGAPGRQAESGNGRARLDEIRSELRAIRSQVEEIEEWHDRARRAPLMRLLTWPLFSRDD